MTIIAANLPPASAGWAPPEDFRVDPQRLAEVERFVLFLGHARSGHSLVGALLNAHPDAVIAHELDALDYIRKGVTRSELFRLLLARDHWFTSQGSEWTGYSYRVPGQWQGRIRKLRVLGDKKGGKSAERLATSPGALRQLHDTVGVPVRIIHVVRNPFDNIATLSLRTSRRGTPLEQCIDLYFNTCATIQQAFTSNPGLGFARVRGEELIADPQGELKRLCGFVGLEPTADYLQSCAGIVFGAPSRSRLRVTWTPALIRRVDERICEFPFLTGYSFNA